ncbi:unnamed protein product [Rotaria sp. Silwood1]|nr:unnamed protein product [Rotaria sp. Silwood1]CAF4765802.1 unnamed protein product [Rotaria sp. Silwood1]CAF5036083.1 unnamed protein product [Rotaria sp. Silwood1]
MTSAPRTVFLNKRSGDHGFGILIKEDSHNEMEIIAIEPNSPAADANIRRGDRILAINGQPVSKISNEIFFKIAHNAQSLILSIQSSNNTLDIIDESSTNDFDNNNNDPYSSTQSKSSDQNCQSYNKGLSFDDNLKPSSLSPANKNEKVLISDQHSIQPHHHRERYHYQSQKIERLTDEELKENIQSSFPRRRASSMDASHIICNSELLKKINEMNATKGDKSLSNIQSTINNEQLCENGIVEHPQVCITEREQTEREFNNRSPSIDDVKLREVHLSRSSGYPGYGFTIKFDKLDYIIVKIEDNSPAEHCGLHQNDIIRKINNQAIETLALRKFFEIMTLSNEITLLVQTNDDHMHINPKVSRPKTVESKSKAINNHPEIHGHEHERRMQTLKAIDEVITGCSENEAELKRMTYRDLESLLFRLQLRIAQHAVDLTDNYEGKIQILSNVYHDQQILVQKVFDEKIRQRLYTIGKRTEENTIEQLHLLLEKHFHTIKVYLHYCTELHKNVPLTGLTGDIVAKIAQNFYKISPEDKHQLKHKWKSCDLPLTRDPGSGKTSFARWLVGHLAQTLLLNG